MEDKCVNVFKNNCEDVRAQVFTVLWIRFLNKTELTMREPERLPLPLREDVWR